MAVNFVEVLDVEGNWQSINLKNIARVCWGEVPDSEKVDMVYLTEQSEVALPHLSEGSVALAEALGIESLSKLVGDSDEDEDEDEDEVEE